jgi:hypothetical protein
MSSLEFQRLQSSVPLAKLLYFNGLYSLPFGAALVFQAAYKLSANVITAKSRVAVPILTAMWCLLELPRLRFGRSGNLSENVRVPLVLFCSRARPAAPLFTLPSPTHPRSPRQVSALAAFLVLTVLPQLPLVVWLCFMSLPDGTYPLDVAVGILQVGLLLAELRVGWAAIRALIGKQTADFIQVIQLEAAARRAAEAAAAAGRDEAAAAARRRRGAGGSRGSALSVRSFSPSGMSAAGGGGGGGGGGGSPLHAPPPQFPAAPGALLLPPRPARGSGGPAEDAASRVRVSDVAGLGIAALRGALGGDGGSGAAGSAATNRRLAQEMGVEGPHRRAE